MTAHPSRRAPGTPVPAAQPSERSPERLEGHAPSLPAAHLPGREGVQLSPGLMKIALAMSEEQLLSKVTLGTRREPGMCRQLGLGWTHHRRSEMTNPGWPDLVIKAPAGRAGVMFRELKKQRGRVTPDQQEWLDALTAAGMDADVWRPDSLLSGQIAHELAALAGFGAP